VFGALANFAGEFIASEHTRPGVTAEQLAMEGLDVDPIHDKLNELGDSLKQARSHVHSFNKNGFERVAAPGEKAVQSISRLVEEAKAECRIRQRGLVAYRIGDARSLS